MKRFFVLFRDVDFLERIILLLFFGWLASRLFMSMLSNFQFSNLLYLVDQGIILSFLMFRRPTQDISRRPSDWVAAFLATGLPMLVGPASGDGLLPRVVCSILILAGMALHLSAKLSLRRSFGVVAANRGVKSTGAYRLIRHPMYAGYMLSEVGFVLASPSLFNAAVIGIVWGLHVFRIMAEERVLALDPAYRELMMRTRFRLIPGLF